MDELYQVQLGLSNSGLRFIKPQDSECIGFGIFGRGQGRFQYAAMCQYLQEILLQTEKGGHLFFVLVC